MVNIDVCSRKRMVPFARQRHGKLARVKVLFAPIGILTGLAAGFAAQKGFERIWAIVEDEQAPEVENREVSYPRLVLALLLEGAISALSKAWSIAEPVSASLL